MDAPAKTLRDSHGLLWVISSCSEFFDMAFTIDNLSVDLTHETATVLLRDGQRSVHIRVPIEPPHKQAANKLQDAAISAARNALQDALRAL